MQDSSAKVQIRPGGLAAFPVEVTAASRSMHTGEEGLVVIVELENFTGKPRQEHINQLIAFVRRIVRSRPLPNCKMFQLDTRGIQVKALAWLINCSGEIQVLHCCR